MKTRIARGAARTIVRSPIHDVALATAFRWRSRNPESHLAFTVLTHLQDALASRGHQVRFAQPEHGSTLAVDLADRWHQAIYYTGVHEPELTALFQEIVRPDTTFLDIGANAGYFSALARGLGADVHTFEPNPRMLDLLHRALASVVTVVPAAVGAEAGSATLHLSPDPGNTGLASLREHAHGAGARVTVRVVTIDGYCEEHGLQPQTVKIDVEGLEDDAVAGMHRLLSDRVPEHVVIELVKWPNRPEPRAVAERVMSYGYEGFAINADGSRGDLTQGALDANDNVYFRRRR